MGHVDVVTGMITFLSYALLFFFFFCVTSKSVLNKKLSSKTIP